MNSAYSIAELRRKAHRQLPRMVFDFVDGGAEEEVTLRRNIEAFAEVSLVPRMLSPTPDVETSLELFGQRISMPLIVAPTGLSGMLWPHGELAATRACEQAKTIMTLSHASTCSLEECAAETDGLKWFNVIIYKDRDVTRNLVERAASAGYQGLVLTVDAQTGGQRERDIRNGYTVPSHHAVKRIVDVACHPRWLWRMRKTIPVTLKNYVTDDCRDLGSVATRLGKISDTSVSWSEFEWIRRIWSGPLIVKGILSPRDAQRAVELGADGIVVSNHGGRQLDSAPASIEVLPAIADAISGNAELFIDGGIRRGSDVLKAIALGARACLIGRAHLWGLASGGEEGVTQSLTILREELKRAMKLGGWNSIEELNRSDVTMNWNRSFTN